MEYYLQHPEHFSQQSRHASLSPHVIGQLIGGYYQLDDAVLREYLGRKLRTQTHSRVNRREMDDVCKRTQLQLGSIMRQVDNIRAVSKRV